MALTLPLLVGLFVLFLFLVAALALIGDEGDVAPSRQQRDDIRRIWQNTERQMDLNSSLHAAYLEALSRRPRS